MKHHWKYTRVNNKLMKGRIAGYGIKIRELNRWERFVCLITSRKLEL